MKAFRKFFVISFSVVAVCAMLWGVRLAIHSSLFLVQVVEVADQPDQAPVDAQVIADLADVKTGEVNLFDLDLREIERRILTNVWIKEVKLTKSFPQTLSIGVVFKEPKALQQQEDGNLSYVDQEGNIFGQVNLSYQPDLPILSGFSSDRLPQALKFIDAWERFNSENGKNLGLQLSSLDWDFERGLRALVIYPLKSHPTLKGRTMVELGQDIDGQPLQFKRLSEVFGYLSVNSISSRQVFADAGKKIVVKTARGS